MGSSNMIQGKSFEGMTSQAVENDKVNNYVKQNITENFIIQQWKNRHTFLKKYTN